MHPSLRRYAVRLGVRFGLAGAMVVAAAAAPAPAAAAVPCANPGVAGTPYQGFGAETTGGAGRPLYRVTTLRDSGRGSLREGLASGDRCIVFDVAGEIVLQRQIYVRGAFVTVDGFTAPPPGITVLEHGIGIWGSHGAHDVILRGVRIRNAGQHSCATRRACYDAIQIKNGAHRVVIDHVSSHHASDGALDISSQSGTSTRDITVQWSIFSGTRNQSLVGRATRVSMHHNLFIDGQNRNPQADWDATLASTPPDTVLDFRNNLVWNFSAYGTLIRRKATANVVNNYYHSSARPSAERALVVDREGRAHASGNRSGKGANVNALGTETVEFASVPVATTDACRAAYEVRDGAGARGPSFHLDAIDARYIAELAAVTPLPGCPASNANVDSAPRAAHDVDRTSGSEPRRRQE